MRRNKTTNKKGFTLAETLVATLILLMVSSIVAAGIPAAKNAYEKTIVRSNAELLMSTAINSLRNEMSVARNVTVEGTTVTYWNGTFGSQSRLEVEGNDILYTRYAYPEGKGSGGQDEDTEPLVSASASDNMHIKYESIDQGNGYIVFNDLGVYKDASGGDSILEEQDLAVTTF